MRTRAWLCAAFLLALATVAGSCRKFVTEPVTRRPVISSVVAFPTTLGPGDSTMITITATDPDGDALVYDWHAYNGLVSAQGSWLYSTRSPSMVFHRSPDSPAGYDTAFVFCYARDGKGGSDGRQVLIFYTN